jgi:hypothetical protein
MKELEEILYRTLCPYVDQLVKATCGEAKIRKTTLESLMELICIQAELTVRKMVKILNQKLRNGELEELKRLIHEDPENAKRAAKYVAKRLKYRVRRILEEAWESDEEKLKKGF